MVETCKDSKDNIRIRGDDEKPGKKTQKELLKERN